MSPHRLRTVEQQRPISKALQEELGRRTPNHAPYDDFLCGVCRKLDLPKDLDQESPGRFTLVE